MTTRTLGVIAAVGLIVAFSTPASAGDIVDQILQTMPPQPAASPAPAVAAPPAAAAPSLPFGAPETLTGGDIVDQAMQQAPPPSPAPLAPTPWTGFYVGLNLGGGSTSGGNSESCINTNSHTTVGCQVIGNSALSTSGVFGGGQFGYLQPLNLNVAGLPLVVGAEADVQGTGIGGSQNVAGPFNIIGFAQTCSPCSYTASQKIDWFGTLRLRIGVPVDRFLIYATGGLMVGGVTASQTENFSNTAGYLVNAKSTLSGPTVGAGVELLLPGNLPLSAKLEALYYDLGSLQTIALPQTNFATNFNNYKTFGFHGAMIRLGINLKLGDIGSF